jgi:hypothetical protein
MARRRPSHKPVVRALLRLHLDLYRKIARHKAQRDSLYIDVWHVEHVLRLLEPGITIEHRRKPNPWFKHGTLFRRAVEILRTARDPMHTREIVWALFRQHGITPEDPLAVAHLVKSVERSLRYHQGGKIVAVGTHPVHWKLAD